MNSSLENFKKLFANEGARVDPSGKLRGGTDISQNIHGAAFAHAKMQVFSLAIRFDRAGFSQNSDLIAGVQSVAGDISYTGQFQMAIDDSYGLIV